jgi:hypothetical protein
MGSANALAHSKIYAWATEGMMMKQNAIASLMRQDFTGATKHQRVNVCRSVGRSMAVCALLTRCISPIQAADALPDKSAATPAASAQKPDYTPKGRQMERYQAFARQTELPAITTTNNTTLEVGGTVKTDLARLPQLSIQEKEALAGQFRIPTAVIGKVVERAANRPQPDAAQLAKDLRTAAVDYRFLQGEWQRYNPPAEGGMIKTNALQALQGGDLSKAWELYDALPRPAPPAILRVISAP